MIAMVFSLIFGPNDCLIAHGTHDSGQNNKAILIFDPKIMELKRQRSHTQSVAIN